MAINEDNFIKEIDWDSLINKNIINSSQKDCLLKKNNLNTHYIAEIRKMGEKIAKKLNNDYNISNFKEAKFKDLIENLRKVDVPEHIRSYLHIIRSLSNIDLHDRMEKNRNIKEDEIIIPIYICSFFLLRWMSNYLNKEFNLIKLKKNICTHIKEDLKFNSDLFIDPCLVNGDKKINFQEFVDKIKCGKLKNHLLLIVGNSGTGKSTALKKLSYILVSDQDSKLLPLFIEMDKFMNIDNQPETIVENLINQFKNNCNIHDIIPKDRLIFILDGLDEFIALNNLNFSDVDKILNKFSIIGKQYSNGCIISSRPSLWVEKKLIYSKIKQDYVFELDEWKENQIEQYIEKKLQNKLNKSSIFSNQMILNISKIPVNLNIILDHFQNIQDEKGLLKNNSLPIIIKNIINAEIQKSLKYIPTGYDINNEILWKILYMFSTKYFDKKYFHVSLDNLDEIPLISEREKNILTDIKNDKVVISKLRDFFVENKIDSYYSFQHEIYPEFLISKLIFEELILRKEKNSNQKLTYFCPQYLNPQILDFLNLLINSSNQFNHENLFINKDLEVLISKSNNLIVSSYILEWISKNFTESFVSTVKFKFNTKEICLNYFKIEKIIPDVKRLQNLLNNYNKWEEIYLENFPFENLPLGTQNLKKLKKLSVQGWKNLNVNSIKFGKLSSLNWLVFKGNNLSRLPNSLKRLRNLEHLNISHNNLRELPSFIVKLQELKELEIHWNQFHLEPSILNHLKKLNKITLDYCQFNQMSAGCWDLPNLKTLSINLKNKSDQKKLEVSTKELFTIDKNKLSDIDEITITEISDLNELIDKMKREYLYH